MQTASAQDLPDGEIRNSYRWAPGEVEMVNAIIGAVWDHQIDQRSGIRPTLSRVLRRMLSRSR